MILFCLKLVKTFPSFANSSLGRLAQATKVLAEVAMRKSFNKPLRLFLGSASKIHMHVTCQHQLVQSWEPCICQQKSWHFVVTVLFHINLAVKLNGVIIRWSFFCISLKTSILQQVEPILLRNISRCEPSLTVEPSPTVEFSK